jgi:hypothetical protein
MLIMRIKVVLAVAAVFALFGSGKAFAQGDIGGGVLGPQQESGFLIGPVGGINLIAYNSNAFPIINSEPTCFTAQNGSGVAPWGGLTAEFPLGSLMHNFIVAEILYDSRSAAFTANNGSIVTRPTKLNGVEAEGSVTTKLTADLNYLLMNLAFKYNFTEGPSPVGPGLQVGPSVGIRLASKFNKTVTVTASSGSSSNPSASQTVTETSDVTSAQSIRIGIRAQFTYDIPFSQSWIATPTVGYDFPFSKVDTDRSWRAQGAYGGLAFRYFWKLF